MPTIKGPKEHPASPAKASKANMAVPPLLYIFEERLNTEGHIIATDKPDTAHPINDKKAYGLNTVIKYPITQKKKI